eukprot:SAG11_NODE_64_length_18817_cov_64.238327_17_plen_93_part_00
MERRVGGSTSESKCVHGSNSQLARTVKGAPEDRRDLNQRLARAAGREKCMQSYQCHVWVQRDLSTRKTQFTLKWLQWTVHGGQSHRAIVFAV